MGAGHNHHHHTPMAPGKGGGHGQGGHGHGAHGKAFALAVALNLGFVATEVIAGLASGSVALLADAGHNLGDVLSLLLAWGASALSARPPSARFTYGLKSSSILAALGNAALLWAALGAIALETIRRFAEPSPVEGETMIVVATAGIAVNALSGLLFAQGRKHDLNLRAAFQHLMADAAVSAGVVIAGALVMTTGLAWIDPVTSLAITAVIAVGSWSLLRDAVKLGLLGVPAEIDTHAVRQFLVARPGVAAIHDLHVWPISTTETALTVHLVMPGGHPGDDFLHHLAHEMDHAFGIGHVTVQVETLPGDDCALSPDSVI